jgi:geranylgeranyl diphosphate synthase type II
MDDDDLRRGRPSSHIKFGEANALLAGDAMLTLAFGVLSEAESETAVCRAVKILAERAGVLGMIGGQYLDLAGENNTLSINELEELDSLKTCALISAACELGCAAASAGEEDFARAAEFAYNLGMAFQITDDILDATGSTEDMGKPVGSDADNSKSTYFTVLGEAAAREKAEMYTRKTLKVLEGFKGDTSFLAELTRRLIDRRY